MPWTFFSLNNSSKPLCARYPGEYMFLLGGNITPGTEKLWGELLFPEEKQFFQGKQMFFSEFFCPRHNNFQPEGYIFLGFHPLTYHKPWHFDGFCFILSLQILHNLLADRPAPRGAAGGAGGGPPCKSKNTTFKIIKKKSSYYRKVASSRPVYNSIFDYFWDVLLTEMCYYCLL